VPVRSRFWTCRRDAAPRRRNRLGAKRSCRSWPLLPPSAPMLTGGGRRTSCAGGAGDTARRGGARGGGESADSARWERVWLAIDTDVRACACNCRVPPARRQLQDAAICGPGARRRRVDRGVHGSRCVVLRAGVQPRRGQVRPFLPPDEGEAFWVTRVWRSMPTAVLRGGRCVVWCRWEARGLKPASVPRCPLLNYPQVFDWKKRAALAADPSVGQLSEGKVSTINRAWRACVLPAEKSPACLLAARRAPARASRLTKGGCGQYGILGNLAPAPGSKKPKNRKGRGIAAGQGATCGFGMRGQKSRSGRPTRSARERRRTRELADARAGGRGL